jgi:putative alpha-1,2-mannosidase
LFIRAPARLDWKAARLDMRGERVDSVKAQPRNEPGWRLVARALQPIVAALVADRQLDMLESLLPELERIAILSDSDIPGADASGLAPIEHSNVAAARAAGLTPQVL